MKKMRELYGGDFLHERRLLGCSKTNSFLERVKYEHYLLLRAAQGETIRKHSFYPDEDKILLLPGREFEVMRSLDMRNQLSMIQLKEVESRFPNIASLPSPSPAVSTPTPTTASGTTATAKVAASPVRPEEVPQSKPTVKSVRVCYAAKSLTDNEIPHVIKEALEQQQCTELTLFGNKITDEGAALLSKALRSNKVRKSFDLFLRIESREILSISMTSTGNNSFDTE